MALENDDLIVVQKNGGGELRKAKIGDIKPDVPINDGAINIDGGDGITASGDNATANQDKDTTRTLSVDETWLSTWLDTNHPLPETFWTEDSGNLYPTTLTNNVGIGTDSPSAPLSFGNTLPANGQTIHTFQSGNVRSGLGIVSGAHRIFTDTASSIAFGQVDAADGETFRENARIDAEGRLGIGTDSPSQKLTVTGGDILVDSNNLLRFGTSDSAAIEASVLTDQAENVICVF